MTDKRTCPDCGEVIKGRSDKKFCSDLCRNNYNNKLNSDTTNYVRNGRIIEELAPDDKAKTHKSKLLEKGFDFGYYTNIYKTQKGVLYYFCYEYGYLPLENDFYFLVKRSEKK